MEKSSKIIDIECKNFVTKVNPTSLEQGISDANTLFNNAKFYYASGEFNGALVSYSCCAISLKWIIDSLTANNTPPTPSISACIEKAKKIQSCCLNAIEVLKEKVKKGGAKPPEEDEVKDWEKICVKVQPLVFKKGSNDCIFFNDVIGLEKEKGLIRSSFVFPLMYPNLYPKASKGILIYGPPGTGKTYMVKAAVNELQQEDKNIGVLYFAPSPGDLKGKYVGETEKKIEEIFTCASKAACDYQNKYCKDKNFISIIFMDEMDAIAGDRSTDQSGLVANSVNTLLQMMDGIKSYPNVAVIGATNYPWNLDAAILRRFDTQILVDLPSESDLFKLMDLEIKKFINLKSDKSSFNFCLDPEYNKKPEKQADTQCDLQCDKVPAIELYKESPYNQFEFAYYENKDIIRSLCSIMKKDGYSNSDLSRLMKAASVNSGQLSIKNNLFYHTSLLNDRTIDKYISGLTPIKDVKKAILASISILQDIYKDRKLSEKYIQLSKPDIPFICHGNHIYFNSKCILYKNQSLMIDNPLIKDVFIKVTDKFTTVLFDLLENSQNTHLQEQAIDEYCKNILAGTYDRSSNTIKYNEASSIGFIICMDFYAKELSSQNTDILEKILKPKSIAEDIILPIIKTCDSVFSQYNLRPAMTRKDWLFNTFNINIGTDEFDEKNTSCFVLTPNENTVTSNMVSILPYASKIIQTTDVLKKTVEEKIKKNFKSFFTIKLDFYNMCLLDTLCRTYMATKKEKIRLAQTQDEANTQLEADINREAREQIEKESLAEETAVVSKEQAEDKENRRRYEAEDLAFTEAIKQEDALFQSIISQADSVPLTKEKRREKEQRRDSRIAETMLKRETLKQEKFAQRTDETTLLQNKRRLEKDNRGRRKEGRLVDIIKEIKEKKKEEKINKLVSFYAESLYFKNSEIIDNNNQKSEITVIDKDISLYSLKDYTLIEFQINPKEVIENYETLNIDKINILYSEKNKDSYYLTTKNFIYLINYSLYSKIPYFNYLNNLYEKDDIFIVIPKDIFNILFKDVIKSIKPRFNIKDYEFKLPEHKILQVVMNDLFESYNYDSFKTTDYANSNFLDLINIFMKLGRKIQFTKREIDQKDITDLNIEVFDRNRKSLENVLKMTQTDAVVNFALSRLMQSYRNNKSNKKDIKICESLEEKECVSLLGEYTTRRSEEEQLQTAAKAERERLAAEAAQREKESLQAQQLAEIQRQILEAAEKQVEEASLEDSKTEVSNQKKMRKPILQQKLKRVSRKIYNKRGKIAFHGGNVSDENSDENSDEDDEDEIIKVGSGYGDIEDIFDPLKKSVSDNPIIQDESYNYSTGSIRGIPIGSFAKSTGTVTSGDDKGTYITEKNLIEYINAISKREIENVTGTRQKKIFVKTSFSLSQKTLNVRNGGWGNNLQDAFTAIKNTVSNIFEKKEEQKTEEEQKKDSAATKSDDLTKQADFNKSQFLLPSLFKNIESIGFLYQKGKNYEIIDDKNIEKNEQEVHWYKLDSSRGLSLFSLGGIILSTFRTLFGTTEAHWSLKLFGFITSFAIVIASFLFLPWAGAIVLGGGVILYQAYYWWQGRTGASDAEFIKDLGILEIFNTIINTGELVVSDFKNADLGAAFADMLKLKLTCMKKIANITAVDDIKEISITTKYPNKIHIVDNTTSTEDSINKKKITNLNIPLESFYYAKSITQSTYIEQTVKDLQQYNKNKDEFLKEFKARPKK
jgi:hypothetical protein